MSHEQSSHQLPAPCIIDNGIIVNKEDIRRLLKYIGRVRYTHTIDDHIRNQGEGYILEVFCHPQQSTLIANHSLYLNVQSFDYLHLHQTDEGETCLDLIQENCQLRLTPCTNPLQDNGLRSIDPASLEAMVTQVLSAKWDVQIDDDDCPF